MTDSYVCTLSANALEKAKRELNEDPANRLGAVQTLREWIEQQPHLVCDTCEYRVTLTRLYVRASKTRDVIAIKHNLREAALFS